MGERCRTNNSRCVGVCIYAVRYRRDRRQAIVCVAIVVRQQLKSTHRFTARTGWCVHRASLLLSVPLFLPPSRRSVVCDDAHTAKSAYFVTKIGTRTRDKHPSNTNTTSISKQEKQTRTTRYKQTKQNYILKGTPNCFAMVSTARRSKLPYKPNHTMSKQTKQNTKTTQ